MGRVKDSLIEKEERIAQASYERAIRLNRRCGICGKLIEDDDESNYMVSGYCNEHAYQMDKED